MYAHTYTHSFCIYTYIRLLQNNIYIYIYSGSSVIFTPDSVWIFCFEFVINSDRHFDRFLILKKMDYAEILGTSGK